MVLKNVRCLLYEKISDKCEQFVFFKVYKQSTCSILTSLQNTYTLNLYLLPNCKRWNNWPMFNSLDTIKVHKN
jgi:hypothetical protein